MPKNWLRDHKGKYYFPFKIPGTFDYHVFLLTEKQVEEVCSMLYRALEDLDPARWKQ